MDTKVGKPLWMVFRDEEEKKRKLEEDAMAPAKKVKATRQPKPPKEPKPDWTVKTWSHSSNTIQSRKQDGKMVVVTSQLKYRGRVVHVLKGPLSKEILEAGAKIYNRKGYTPSPSMFKTYCEMSDDERLELANKHSPELPFA